MTLVRSKTKKMRWLLITLKGVVEAAVFFAIINGFHRKEKVKKMATKKIQEIEKQMKRLKEMREKEIANRNRKVYAVVKDYFAQQEITDELLESITDDESLFKVQQKLFAGKYIPKSPEEKEAEKEAAEKAKKDSKKKKDDAKNSADQPQDQPLSYTAN